MSNVGLGLVGAGRIAQAAHLPAVARAQGARLVAICDPSPLLIGELAPRHGVPGYTTIDELLANDEVEAVILAVPDRLHLSLGSQALRAGKHVLVEKPLAASVEEAEELAAVAASSGLQLQVGAMKRYDPGVQFAADAVRSRIGKVLAASLWYRVHARLRSSVEATFFPQLVVDEQVRGREAAFKQDRSAYLLATHGAHVLDGLRYLLGESVAITARQAHHGDDYSWHGLAELSEGGLANFEITASVHAEWSEGADIYGEHGRVKLQTYVPFALRASDVEVFDEMTATATRPVFPDSNPYERQIEAFVRAIREGSTASPDGADGVAALRLIATVAESVASGGSRVTV